MSLPPELLPYLRGLADRLAQVLGPRLVGVYVGGSVALDAYRHGRSDIDVAAVTDGEVSRAEKDEIVAALRHESFPCPARGLELVVYRLDIARSGTTEPGFELNLNTGERMPFRVDAEPDPVEAHWFALDRSILAAHGLAIVGPPADTVFGPIARASLLPVLSAALEWHTQGMGRADDAVLNAARALRFVLDSVWSSKPEAGQWALSTVADCALVLRALESRDGRGPDVSPEEAAAFVADVKRQISNAEAVDVN
jgi:hypothetical protein